MVRGTTRACASRCPCGGGKTPFFGGEETSSVKKLEIARDSVCVKEEC